MKRLFLIPVLLMLVQPVTAQKYIARNGQVSFFSEAPLENIEAHNSNAVSIIDGSTGEVVANILMKAFHFEKALMEEHFNEKYVESEKYPKSVFKGTITNLSDIDLTKPGNYKANVEGEITIHGVTKPLEAAGDIVVEKDGVFSVDCKFNVTVKDFEIKIPKLVVRNIAEVVEVTLKFNYTPYGK